MKKLIIFVSFGLFLATASCSKKDDTTNPTTTNTNTGTNNPTPKTSGYIFYKLTFNKKVSKVSFEFMSHTKKKQEFYNDSIFYTDSIFVKKYEVVHYLVQVPSGSCIQLKVQGFYNRDTTRSTNAKFYCDNNHSKLFGNSVIP